MNTNSNERDGSMTAPDFDWTFGNEVTRQRRKREEWGQAYFLDDLMETGQKFRVPSRQWKTPASTSSDV